MTWILYSARGCLGCLRARRALAAAGLRPGIDLEIREVRRSAPPPELLDLSPQAALPVLADGGESAGEREEPLPSPLVGSLAIARWARARRDPGQGLEGWSPRALAEVLASPWVSPSAWRSPRWLYHLALRRDWRQARRDGEYRRSSLGLSLAEVGFIHLSQAHQVPATFARFYADLPAGAVLLLSIDPVALAAAGLVVRQEPAPESGELFPHLYGALPLGAVLLAEPMG